jgi:hypothetical protein
VGGANACRQCPVSVRYKGVTAWRKGDLGFLGFELLFWIAVFVGGVLSDPDSVVDVVVIPTAMLFMVTMMMWW